MYARCILFSSQDRYSPFLVLVLTLSFITMMSCLIILPLLYIYELPITIHLVWIPIGVLLAGFMALGFGMMMAPLNCVQRDVQHLIRFITRAGFFVSPVMWTAEMAMELIGLGAKLPSGTQWFYRSRWFVMPSKGRALNYRIRL